MISPALRYARANSGLTFSPDSSCVLWMPGQDDPQSAVIRDRSGSRTHGAITGATWVRLSSGLWCLSFNGTDQYVTIGDVASLDITGDISIEFWFNLSKLPSVATRRYYLIGKSNAVATNGWGVDFPTTDRMYFRTHQAAASQATFTAVDLYVISTWYHFRATRTGNDALIYLNDIDVTATSAAHVNPTPAGQTAYIGASGTDLETEGMIALPRVYNAVVAGHYNEERHLFGV